MKINGINVIGVKHLAGILKGLNGYGLHYEVFLPIEGGKLKIHEHVSGNSWTVCDPDEYKLDQPQDQRDQYEVYCQYQQECANGDTAHTKTAEKECGESDERGNSYPNHQEEHREKCDEDSDECRCQRCDNANGCDGQGQRDRCRQNREDHRPNHADTALFRCGGCSGSRLGAPGEYFCRYLFRGA